MLGEPDRRSRGAPQSRGALLFCTARYNSRLFFPFRGSHVIRRSLPLLTLLCLSAPHARLAGQSTPFTFSEFFKPGTVFQDRNGDGVVDFGDARIVLPPQPAAGELAAAADIAARLGY